MPYAIGIGAVTLAFAADIAVGPLLQRSAMLPFLLAVVVTAWYAGRNPALVALAVGSVEAAVTLQQPSSPISSDGLADLLSVTALVLAGGLATLLTVGLRATDDRARREALAADRARAQLLGVLESVAYPVAVIDDSGRLLFANAAASAFLDTSERAEVERRLDGMLRAAVGDTREAQATASTAAIAIPAHARIQMEAGSGERWADVQVRPISGGRRAPEGTVVAWHDVTVDHETEVAREAFMGVLAHELRTPITTVFGGAQLLVSRGDHLLPQVRADLAQDMLHEATRLNRIADNLLVLSRVERGQLRVDSEPILLEPLVRSVIDLETVRWPDISFQIEGTGGRRPVSGSPGYVEQVLHNLLSNAAKYSPAGTTVHVRFCEEASETTVVVADEGPGIDPDDAERLFELFYRSPATASQAPGSGIGLYVCRQLLNAMGGRIWARRSEDGGAEFSFALAAIPEAAAADIEESLVSAW